MGFQGIFIQHGEKPYQQEHDHKIIIPFSFQVYRVQDTDQDPDKTNDAISQHEGQQLVVGA